VDRVLCGPFTDGSQSKIAGSGTNDGSLSTCRAKQDLKELSALGHFLKGSSATLGFTKIRDSCQVIQQYGNGLNMDGTREPSQDVCLKKITEAIKTAKHDTTDLEEMMNKFFKNSEQ
jgi:osomolarity two-component system phosphorelay intermediate protein YPD1